MLIKLELKSMEIKVRQAVERDKNTFVDFTVTLSKFNRSNRNNEYKYDDYELALNAIQRKAE